MIIYNVYHVEEFVGSFLQASFSTRDKAEHYAANNLDKYPMEEMSVIEYELDSSIC